MSLIPKIQRLYFHACDKAPGSYKPHALRMDSWLYRELHMSADFSKMVSVTQPSTSMTFMGMKLIVEGYNDGSKKHHLTVEMKQKGEDGRSIYFEYADLTDDAHYARPGGTQPEHLTTDDTEPPANGAQ